MKLEQNINEPYIFYAHLSQNNHKELKRLSVYFSNPFQKRIEKFKRWQDSQASIIGRLLLVIGLHHLGRKFDSDAMRITPFQKPYLKDDSIRFNISHSGNIVICAISNNFDLGIDVEFIKDLNIADFKSQMTMFEWNQVISSDNAIEAFFRYWTQKEAVIKAQGMGLSIPLKSFKVDNGRTLINGDLFFTEEIELDDHHKCHIATKQCLSERKIHLEKIDVIEEIKSPLFKLS